jgi:hypothetical protein
MSPTSLGYRELGLKLVYIEENCSLQPKKPPMEEEKRDVGGEYNLNILLTEALVQQRNDVLENVPQILQQ